ncbi:CPK12 [Symbiodinium pilosum]|uniref:CPK12 protein n=1 Tax=Symbiodinium pilosum TaxID=2952 RepID=A0A812P6T0_SYMPI|nr:CPK12 [Symbiodinium pilosum]
MRRRWKVVGGRSSGGLVVREGPDLGAKSARERLGTGAIIEEETRLAIGTCDRLRYRKLMGQGPETGWISFEANGAHLITPVKPVSFKETSWLETTRYQEIAEVRTVVEANCTDVMNAVAAAFQGFVHNSTASFSLGLRPLFPAEQFASLTAGSDAARTEFSVLVASDASRQSGAPLRPREHVQSTVSVSEQSCSDSSRQFFIRVDCDRITEAVMKSFSKEEIRELESHFEVGCVFCTLKVQSRADGRTELVRGLLGGSVLMEAAPGMKPTGKPDFSQAIPLLASQVLFMLDVETRVWLSIHGFRLVDVWRGIRRPFQWAVFSGMNTAASQIYALGSATDTLAEQELGLDLPMQVIDELQEILPVCKNAVGTKQGQFTEGSVDIPSFIWLLNRVCRRADKSTDIFREFVDLGSGRGHALLAAHAFFPFRKCCGYEIDEEAFDAAEMSARQYIRSGLALQARSAALPHKMFVQADFISKPNWTDSSVVFVNGVTWPKELLAATATLALRLKPGSVIIVVARRFPVDNMEMLRAFDVRGDACLLSFSQTRWPTLEFQLRVSQRLPAAFGLRLSRCLLFILLSGRHPFNADPGGRLLPSAARTQSSSQPPEPDWRLLPSASSTSLCAQMLSWDVKARPSAAECLRHSWLSAEESDCMALPMEALGNLLKAHHKSKLQEITAGLAISEQIASPFSAVGAALAVKRSFPDLAGDVTAQASQEPVVGSVTSSEASGALKKLGMSDKGIEKVIKAFSDDTGSVDHKLLICHCTELAEDLLDHALWRVFTAAGEDHRGVLGAAELEKALAESAGEGGADRAGGGEPEGPFGSEMKASDIVRQVACGRQQVTFEELRAAVIQRQSVTQADSRAE